MPLSFTPIQMPASSGAGDEVFYLNVGYDDTQRIWVDDPADSVRLTPIHGRGPKDYRPFGYLLADDRIIVDAGTPRTAVVVAYVRDYFTGAMRDVHDRADFPGHLTPPLSSCFRCANPTGKRHAATCPNHGKIVGEKVR